MNKLNKFAYAGIAAVALAVGAYVFVGTGVTTAPESTFVLLDGSKINTASLKGKVTLVNFWAKGFDTVSVAMSYDPPAYVVNYAETRKLPFKVAIDNTGAVAKAWNEVKLTPTTYIVDKQGQIVKRYVGEPNFTELHALIEKLLAAS
jgi:cytochrome oxidase Cu insertion factor (SCO1/SenC/PrrC family)